MILHVAGAEHAARVDVFKLGENLFRTTPSHVKHHVQAPSMTHAHDQIDGAALAGVLENFVDQGQERGIALERKTLGAQITLLQDLLKDVGAHEQVEHARLIDRARFGFEALLNPAPALRVSDVHEFHAHGAAVEVPGLAGVIAFDLQFCRSLRAEQA